MKQSVFVVFDLKSKTTASQFMLASNEAIIKRNLITYGQNISQSIKTFPEDFAVFSIGEYEDTTMAFEALKQPQMCFSMKEVIDYGKLEQAS